MHGKRVLPLVVATLVLVSGSFFANAKTFESACTVDISHGARDKWRDLGNGFVSFYESWGHMAQTIVESATGKIVSERPNSIYHFLSVESCATGRVLIVPVYSCVWSDGAECQGGAVELNVRKQTEALVDEATSPSTNLTFDDLFLRFQSLSPEASVVEAAGVESCECHVAYPKMRGSKLKYKD